ncbi:TetR family transcriptional regulator [Aldersonia sp. NBC_00410]|uniref:TetR/AcrR family transcriptional regulator n=1 Tax=Aldersonia sp. NBC_00410 TaxID=2975954 RepID=UPI002250CC2D|nr:TetR family transcriptional regulator [Aldersonia sp. NBC_00410]MCX5043796.1 TetR family transcriptional regulator [Aldersonia sp. NBC_00410]
MASVRLSRRNSRNSLRIIARTAASWLDWHENSTYREFNDFERGMVKHPEDASSGRTSAQRGRRPGVGTTRTAILDAARRQFAERGYDRTSVRGVAVEAHVDPKMVTHWFPTKQQLFQAAVELPVRPADTLREVLAAGAPETLGERLAEQVLGSFEDPMIRERWLAFYRATVNEPAATAKFRDVVMRDSLRPIAELLGGDRAELRAELLASQVVGVLMARYVMAVEPLASLSIAEVARLVGPVLQHYLTVELD